MDGMMSGGPGPMQGLAAARPAPAQEPQSDPQAAAMSILQDAVSQFGPEIIGALQAVLASVGSSGGEAGMEGSGMMGGMSGMMGS